MENIIRELHPLEIKVLLRFSPEEEIRLPVMRERLGFNQGQCNQAVSWLAAKELIEEKNRTLVTFAELTDLGRSFQKDGIPEERILKLLESGESFRLPQIADKLSMENRDVGSAYGQLSRDGVLTMDADKQVVVADTVGVGAARIKALRSLLDKLVSEPVLDVKTLGKTEQSFVETLSKKRGAARGVFRITEREEVVYAFSTIGTDVRKDLEDQNVTGEEVGALTPELLQQGGWKDVSFRSYNMNTPPVRVLLGRKNPYVEFLEDLKDKLVSLGFEEFDGPLVETEFWNSDALFMPQFHAARDIHDVFNVNSPTHAKEIEQPYLDNVAAAHENGAGTGSRGWQ